MIGVLKPIMNESEYLEFHALIKMVNSLTGPITSLALHLPDFFDPPILACIPQHYRIEHVITPSWIRNPGVPHIWVPAGGKGFDLFNSLMGAIGEAIERILSVLFYVEIRDQIIYSTYADLNRKGFLVLGPDEIPLFADWQYSEPDFRFQRFEKQSLIGWLQGTKLISGEKIFVPAQLVMMYYKTRRDERTIGYTTTGGLACRKSKKEAITHGILESIERDAINLRWCCNLPFTRIRTCLDRIFATQDPKLQRLTHGLQDITLYYASVDIQEVKVVTAFAFNQNIRELAFSSGGAAALDLMGAVIGAVTEVGQSYSSLKHVSPEYLSYITQDSTWRDLNEFFDSLIYYGYNKNMRKLIARLDNSRAVMSDSTDGNGRISSEGQDYKRILKVLKKHEMDAIIFDFTPSTTLDYNIEKVFMPQLTLAFAPNRPLLGHPRYYDLPKKLGYAKRKLKPIEISQEPVPLP